MCILFLYNNSAACLALYYGCPTNLPYKMQLESDVPHMKIRFTHKWPVKMHSFLTSTKIIRRRGVYDGEICVSYPHSFPRQAALFYSDAI